MRRRMVGCSESECSKCHAPVEESMKGLALTDRDAGNVSHRRFPKSSFISVRKFPTAPGLLSLNIISCRFLFFA